MEFPAMVERLEELGSEQTRKIYMNHGVKGNQYGVSYKDMRALAKKIKKDSESAISLWGTENHDARILATMIMDPKDITDQIAENWVQNLDNYVIMDAFSDLVGNSSLAMKKMKRWTKDQKEYVGASGWNILAKIAMRDESLDDTFFYPFLDTIAESIHDQEYRVRYSMNSALIAIGIRNGNLRNKAEEVGLKIGKVIVDHGKTSCKTPDAVSYIAKTYARREKKAKK